jgi:uncharacterized OB-fold protein
VEGDEMKGQLFMGTVEQLREHQDPNYINNKYLLAVVNLDNGSWVSVDPAGLKAGDRVKVRYDVFQYSVVEKLPF